MARRPNDNAGHCWLLKCHCGSQRGVLSSLELGMIYIWVVMLMRLGRAPWVDLDLAVLRCGGSMRGVGGSVAWFWSSVTIYRASGTSRATGTQAPSVTSLPALRVVVGLDEIHR